jgi:hypothetical protein
MFSKTIENTSPKRQRVNESRSVHSLSLRACRGAEHSDVQLSSELATCFVLADHYARLTDNVMSSSAGVSWHPVHAEEFQQKPDASACRLIRRKQYLFPSFALSK